MHMHSPFFKMHDIFALTAYRLQQAVIHCMTVTRVCLFRMDK